MNSGPEHPVLSPYRLGGLDLRNRLAVAPMTRVSATPDGVPTPQMARYYRRFAEGRFGLVITEGTYTDTAWSQGYLNQPGIVTGEQRRRWAEVVESVHAAGAPLVLQLMHAGALSQGNRFRHDTAGPSAVRPLGQMMPEYGGGGPWPVPRELTTAQIEEAVEGFVASAVAAREAGFDGVEIHGANGYLLDQFLTVHTNLRTDRYGGPAANRIRLAAEVTAAVRAAAGPDMCVGVRLSQTKVNDFVYRWPGGTAEAEAIFTALATAGASYLHLASEGRNWLDTAVLDNGVTITGLARRVTGLPVLANGGMHDSEQAERVLDGGHADVLAVARGALANPDLPRAFAGHAAMIDFDHAMLDPVVTLDNADGWWSRRTAVSPA
jgi:2,4-dienoyl-CoA reductase-like NADH-dependent reductase (Old Yellow Enzyme family)